MTFRNIHIFVKVAEGKKMSEVAKELGISQSSVSQAISDIEKEYDVRLFERLAKSLFLTDVGETFLTYARQLISLQSTVDEYLRQQNEHPRLHIGATLTVGTCLISPIVLAIDKQYQKLRTEVYVDNTHVLEEKLLRNELDIALIEGRITSKELVTRPVIDDNLVLVCPKGHPFFGRDFVTPDELAHQSFLFREPGSGTREQIEEQLNKRSIPFDITWTSSNTSAIITGVKDGHGITVLSERLIKPEPGDTLWCCDIKGMYLKRSFDIVYHKNKFMSDVLLSVISEIERYAELERAAKRGAAPG